MTDGVVEVQAAIRSLSLPLDPSKEEAALNAAIAALDGLGVDANDRAVVLRGWIAGWHAVGAADSNFRHVLNAALGAGLPSDLASLNAKRYVGLIDELTEKGSPRTTIREAADLVADAAIFVRWQSASAARLDEVFGAGRAHYSPLNVERVLAKVGSARALEATAVAEAMVADHTHADELFANADYADSLDIVHHATQVLGITVDLRQHLQELTRAGSINGPLFAMLYRQCLIQEFFDHPITNISSFHPRGSITRSILAALRAEFEFAPNAFLNNAKGVSELDRNWAATRGHAAHSLVSILRAVAISPYTVRRQVSLMLRAWILHAAQLLRKIDAPLPLLSVPQAETLLDLISAGPTNTLGILEQKLVDAAVVAKHPSPPWILRGLGDSVNASNTSARKLGDVDVQEPTGLVAIAYEAHSGNLSQPYVEEHLRTIAPSLRLRRGEWAGLTDPDDWSIRVVFVAHAIAPGLPPVTTVDGVPIDMTYLTFAELRDDALRAATAKEAIDLYLVESLNSSAVPSRVRAKAASAI